MSAYLIGQISVKNDELWRAYVAGVQQSLEAFDSEIVFRGPRVSVLSGQHDYGLVVLIKFSDHTTLYEWFYSDLYQSLIPLRKKAADVVITTYED